MDASRDHQKARDHQTARFLAFILVSELGTKRATVEQLSRAFLYDTLTPSEIQRLCAIPNVPLRLLEHGFVEIITSSLSYGLVNPNSFVSLLCNQTISRTDPSQHVVRRPPTIECASIVKPGVIPQPPARTPLEKPNNNTLDREEKPPLPAAACPGEQEKSPLAAAVACPGEQGLVAEINKINAQPKKKSRDPRSVPRFADFSVEGEVGSGGYGTVYKVRRHRDGQVFAMKCPLENTHDSCVRNEIKMLKRLRGKDYIIQIQSEMIGKILPKPEAVGAEEMKCPSILLEFIEHDKPEVLKKEITIDDLRCYSLSLFGALTQLHKERILHLDIKPGNFLFSRATKKGCLVDFNLARDESAKRFSTRRPERGSTRAGAIEAKALEKRKGPKRALVHDEAAARKRSKICRQLQQMYPDLAIEPNGTFVGDQSKVGPVGSKDSPTAPAKYLHLQQSRSSTVTGAFTTSTKHAEHLKANDTLDNTGTAQKLEATKTQQNGTRGLGRLPGNHRLSKFFKDDIHGNAPTVPFPQSKGVPALKPNPNKRIPAGAPHVPPPTVPPSSTKRVKPKVKGPFNHIKDGPCVGTKGYRAPEVLMRSTRQTTKVDMWSAGVSLLQLVTGRSPFPSTSTDGSLKDIARLRGSAAVDKLAKSLGQPSRFSSKDPYEAQSLKEWAERHSKRTDLKGRIPSTLYDLLERCLEVNPDARITAEAALQHRFCLIDSEPELSKHQEPS